MSTITKNGKAYDSGDAQIVIDGEIFDEVSEITYSNEQEHQLNFGLGNKATSWSMGKITPTASVTMLMADSIRLEKKAGGSLLNLPPVTIQVSFVNDYNEIINDTIVAKFQSEGREVTGEMGLKKQYDLFAISVNLLT
ncbi:hypothetical protein [Pedobacter sp. WC2423]|uniref:hypothetical protein n=1 Tax=Pedobacter sp. WC2423 TaxID=3234142 RepID=UPI0034651C2B